MILRHELIAVVHPLPAVEAERERKGLLKIIGGSCGHALIVGHARTLPAGVEQIKNTVSAEA